MLLTDDLLLDYQRCQRRGFLNLYGNSQEKDPERDFLLKLRQESQSHVKKVLQDSYPDYCSLTTPTSDILAAARETEALMRQGVSCIYHGVLLQSGYPVSLTGSPHLLINRQESQNLVIGFIIPSIFNSVAVLSLNIRCWLLFTPIY